MSPPRTPLLRPDRYFADRTADPARGVLVGILTIITFVGGVYVPGWIPAVNIDGTVTVDTTAYPGDSFCDGESPDGFSPSGCDEPTRVERNVDHLVRQAIGSIGGQVALGLPVVWLLIAGGLHAGSAIANGERSFGRTLTFDPIPSARASPPQRSGIGPSTG
ncbi:hypothetical protein BRC89_13520 [Halobacteriales archaeon QS_4_70_19]|nr:MAG: hypothetical protein BRC89_13520 [Halobacteriales archaeon QS_4_70_19]